MAARKPTNKQKYVDYSVEIISPPRSWDKTRAKKRLDAAKTINKSLSDTKDFVLQWARTVNRPGEVIIL